ncbi:MAG: branched-chain amino acid ABC transporter permease, partial [Betaproteobacteria bacterium]|nr:branched-chain amino acid ABC transporter permease [Betaproteobacteria bacterium]
SRGLGDVYKRQADQFGLAYAPTYSVVFTFVILILVLAFRPRGILGKPA